MRDDPAGCLRNLAASVLEIGVLLSLVGSLAGFLGGWSLLADVLGSFRIQYITFLLIAGLLLLKLRPTRLAAWVAGLGILLNLLALLPIAVGGVGESKALPERETYTLVTFNVHGRSRAYEETIGYLRAADADFLLLLEIRPEWWARLEPAFSASHPHRIKQTHEGNFGIALFSKHPWDSAEIRQPPSGGTPSVDARFTLHGQSLRLVGVHPPPPIGPGRNEQLAALTERFAQEGFPPTIVAGDFNTVPWSPVFRRFLRENHLHHHGGRSLEPTWYGAGGIGGFLDGIPIDHVVASEGIRLLKLEVGPDLGSDHRPLVQRFQLLDPTDP